MYHDSKILNVFLASPGDLTEERRIAPDVVDELNQSMGRQLNWRIELLGWEDTMPGFFRPQEKINEDVDRCQLFVGLLWKRWGQPPGAGDYESGFEEEFDRASQRRLQDGLPEIWLFLKTLTDEVLRDPGEQLKKVLAFRKAIEAKKTLKYVKFDGPDDWEKLFRKSLTSYLLELSRREGSLALGEFPTSSPDVRATESIPAKSDDSESSASKDKHSEKAIKSLATVSDAVKNGALGFSGNTELDGTDLARLTVLASAFFAARFPDELLDVHQANFLYKSRQEIPLTEREWSIAVRSAFGSTAKRIPGWFWLRPTVRVRRYFIDLAVRDLNNAVRVGAARTFDELEIVLSAREKKYLLGGVAANYEENVVKATLRWLNRQGNAEDVWFLDRIRDEHSTLKSEIETCRLQIIARHLPSKFVSYITTSDIEVPDTLPIPLFSKIEARALESLLGHKNVSVRRLAARVLSARKQLSKEVAISLIDDSDAGVRVIAIRTAIELGAKLNSRTIRDKVPKRGGLLAAMADPDSDADELVRKSFATLSFSELQEKLDWDVGDSVIAYEILGLHHFAQFSHTLREDIADNFETYRRRWEEKIRSRIGDAAKPLIADYETKGLHDFIRSQFVAAALHALAANGTIADEKIVRSFRNSNDSNILTRVAEFLGREGNDGDVATIIDIATKTWSNIDGLASSIYRISKNPSALCIDGGVNERIRAKLLGLLSSREVSILKPQWITLLLAEDAELRKQTVRRIAAVTAVKERRSILNSYLGQPTYYYEVIFWFDRLSYSPKPWISRFFILLERDIKNPFDDYRFYS
jgi:hypothetical protein